ncbi:MAG: type II toxin-antitoxin system VapC family toxin [Xenococcaceae cyanobacterium]
MTQKVICVDANFVVFLVQAASETSPFIVLWDEWQKQGYQIITPTLFGYEVTNVFHRMSVAGQILPEEAEQLLEEALNLGITLYGDRALHERALALAKNLNLPAAYDAHYLALSERFNAEFYTSDKRLFNSVKETITWIHLVK